MHGSDFSHRIEDLKQQTQHLQQHVTHPAQPAPDILQAALQQLHSSLGQMQDAHQAMLQHYMTIQEHAERRLRETEDRYRQLVEMSPDGLLVHRDGRIVFANPAAAGILGAAEPRQLIDRKVLDLVHPDFRSQVQRRVELVHSGTAVPLQEEKLLRLDGQVVCVEVAAAPVIFDDRPAVQCLCRDITERKRLQEEVVAISDMERSRIGRDLHDVLGQNLTGISFVGKVLDKRLTELNLPEAAEAREICELAGQSMRQARALARGLFPVELRAGEFVASLKALAMDAQHMFGILCRFDFPRDRQLILDDKTATHLYHIAQECLTNAVKHGKTPSVHIRLEADTTSLTLSIQDEGTGFQDGQKVGGIGLRIMRHRASLLGGQLMLQSRMGGGTTVTCRVPAR